MQQIGGVHVFETFEALVNDILLMNILQNIGSNNGMQIRIHEIEDEIDIPVVFCSYHILQSNDVLVTVQLLEEYNFTECTLSVSCILESIEVFLYGDDLL